MAGRRQEVQLPADTSSVGRARRAADAALDEWGLGHLADEVLLLASELVTNVVLHVGAPSRLVLAHLGERLRVEVHDTSPAMPVAKDYGATATTGRGLGLVATLGSAWGAERTRDGKVVWFELPTADSGGNGRHDEPRSGELDVDDLDALEAALLGTADAGGPTPLEPRRGEWQGAAR